MNDIAPDALQTMLIQALADHGHILPAGALEALDARRLGSSADLRAALATGGVQAVLLRHVGQEGCADLLKVIGIRPDSIASTVLIRKLESCGSSTNYHVVEVPVEYRGGRRQQASGSGCVEPSTRRARRPLGEDTDSTDGQTAAVANGQSRLERFAEIVAKTWALPAKHAALQAGEEQPIQQSWYYTKTYNFTPSGDKANGYTPASDQEFSVSVTYTFTGLLDQAQSGNFQWLYVETLGYMSTGDMSTNKYNHRGWGNGAVKLTVAPPAWKFYSASPTNTNKEKQVTTSAGFEVGLSADGGSGTYSYSQEESNSLKDWEVTLDDFYSWTYKQSSPFNGTTESFPTGAVKYDSWDVRHELKSWPDLTKKVFDWTTMTVGRIEPATSKTVSIGFSLELRANFMQIKNVWPDYSGRIWWYQTFPYSSFQLDMSAVNG